MNKQITEDYVSYEIAKLLKEKGFDGRENHCHAGYFNENLIDYTLFGFCDGEITLAPTMQMALKWLRLCYDIIIDVSPNLTLDDVCKGGFMSEVYQYGHRVPDGEFGCNIGDEYTYEEVVEASLLYVLKNLI